LSTWSDCKVLGDPLENVGVSICLFENVSGVRVFKNEEDFSCPPLEYMKLIQVSAVKWGKRTKNIRMSGIYTDGGLASEA